MSIRTASMRGAALILLFAVNASAAELTGDQSAMLYHIAIGHMGYIPEHAPEVRITADMPCRACKGYQAEGTVYVLDTLDFAQPHDSSILLHEFVHYVQWSRDGTAKGCSDWLAREAQAYGIQALSLERAGEDSQRVRLAARMVGCR